MRKQISRKLTSNRGESIGETLMALLISALALMMLAGAVSAAMRVVTRSNNVIDGYYQVGNAMVARASAAPTGDTYTVNDAAHFSGTLSITIDGLRPTTGPIDVNYWKNEQLSGAPVIAYALPTPAP